MNQSPFRCFATSATYPLLKTNAPSLVSNEEWVKRLLLLYKWPVQPYVPLFSLATTANAYCHFPPVRLAYF